MFKILNVNTKIMIDFRVLELGYHVSQKKNVSIGNYVIKFHRRKISKGDYIYLVEVFYRNELKKKGIFTEYSNAVIFAGQIMLSLL
ncbi:hypothetical protein DFR86_02940 [Acidianus sulfidivorans JP7]|uniref:Uncharacterized protein n=1 Tax=Acidianus sulfidivorans JP7 TaxID=619593 RepID=A0A2U9IKN6_9CREN|nr:hypothetical protein [Acidianus sulfidivorans]AWR96608.1 hypothetical protein DFR86_02940 [Acidianus sulfidivorans JP7]